MDKIEIEGSVITIDAAGCQREIVRKIIVGKGDYVLALKGNQGKLHAAITTYITENMETDFADVATRKYAEQLKGHGRVDEITYYQMPVPPELLNKDKWAVLKTIGVAIRQSQSGSKTMTEVRFYLKTTRLGDEQWTHHIARFNRVATCKTDNAAGATGDWQPASVGLRLDGPPNDPRPL